MSELPADIRAFVDENAEGLSPDTRAFVEDVLVNLEGEELDKFASILRELRDMSEAERRQLLRLLRKPEEVRAEVLAELEAGREPDGELLGDWLACDPALQAFFRMVMGALRKDDTILHLAPMGLVSAA